MPMTHINAVTQVDKFVRLKDNGVVFVSSGPHSRVFGHRKGLFRSNQFSHLDEVPEKEMTWAEAQKTFGDWIDGYKP